MKIFLDSTDIPTINRLFCTGLIDGVTTNPTLVKKAGKPAEWLYDQLAEIGIPDISMEVSGTAEEMFYEGLRLKGKYGSQATIKLPMTVDGLNVTRQLSKQNIRTNVTLVFTIPQAILAAKAGATYVSPFVGRLDDQQIAGLEVVRGIASLYQMKNVRTKVLAASIRDVHRAVRSFYNGADVVTMPPTVFERMSDHILTDAGLEIFNADVAAIAQNNY